MAKTRNFKPELRHFVGVLNSFKGYYYDYDIFRDFINYATACLLWEGDIKLAEELKHRYKSDYSRFGELYLALAQTMQDQLPIEGFGWYDALGTLYEEISSRQKSSMMGQFFTPPSLCDMTAQMLTPTEREEHTITVNDPSAGSGRMLLAFNAIYPGAYHIAQDLDPICTKMSAINMAMHGIKGQAVNGDTLQPDDFNFGYEVNSHLYTTAGFPHLHPITKETSFPHRIYERRKNTPKALVESFEKPQINIQKPIQTFLEF